MVINTEATRPIGYETEGSPTRSASPPAESYPSVVKVKVKVRVRVRELCKPTSTVVSFRGVT
jgi:hypothetical protein